MDPEATSFERQGSSMNNDQHAKTMMSELPQFVYELP
jgi:hypothetical protein